MDRTILELTIKEHREFFLKKEDLISREFPKNLITNKKITVISGIRRCGKSTLLKQISKSYKNDEFYYLNFEDERFLNLTFNDFNIIYEIFLKLYGDLDVFFFDEIQNVFGWEKFIRRLFEDGKKIYITGSNAKLLSSELATSLTGRHLKYELYPFSFKEYLNYHNFEIENIYTTKNKSNLLRLYEKYIKIGGFPEVIISEDTQELKQLYQDTLIKDLIVRFKIRDTKSFRELVLYLISNVSKKISFNNLKNILQFNSVTTVKSYIDFLDEVYLVFSLYKFDFSIKKQIVNDRKIYGIDTGLINSVSFMFSENIGRLFENLVFIELKRRSHEIYYHNLNQECDFVIKEGLEITQAIQVTRSLEEIDTKKREIAGLLDACKTYKLKEGLILTEDEGYELEQDGVKIQVMPVWKWLLSETQ